VSGETDLARLLASMSPVPRPGRYVFVTTPVADTHTGDTEPGDTDPGAAVPGGTAPVPSVRILASILEDEGLSILTSQSEADEAGLGYDYVAGWITLRVHSALAAVGLTAAVSEVLAAAGISCNVVAGYHHDHLLVPHERVGEAVELLDGLSRSHSAPA
jgi:hypothetical protein